MEQQELSTGLEELLAASNAQPETLEMYGGQVILFYHHGLHAYYSQDDKGVKTLVPGVTSAVDKMNKPALVQWAANSTVAYLREKMKPVSIKIGADVVKFVNHPELETMLNDARFNFRNISQTATDIGHIAHDWLEQYIKLMITRQGLEPWEAGDEDCQIAAEPQDEKATNCVRAALGWFDKHNFRPDNAERKIYSREYSYAGTFDWSGWITLCDDRSCCPFSGEVYALGDFKSSKNLYDEYRIQTAAYVVAAEEEDPTKKFDVRVLLRLGKEDGEFETMVLGRETLEDDFNAYLGCLSIFNWEKQIQLDRKYNKAVKKAEAKVEKEALAAAKKALKKVTPKKVKIKELAVEAA